MKGVEPFSIYQPQGYHAHPLECVPCARLSLLSALVYAPLTLAHFIEVAAWLFVRMPRHEAKEKPKWSSTSVSFPRALGTILVHPSGFRVSKDFDALDCDLHGYCHADSIRQIFFQ